MRTSTYKELPEELRGCFGRTKRAACGACWDKHPEAAEICLVIRMGYHDGYIKLLGHDPIKVTDGPNGEPLFTVKPETGAQPPATTDPRQALIFAERIDNETPTILDGAEPQNLFPTTLYG